MPTKAIGNFAIHNQITEYCHLSKSAGSLVLEEYRFYFPHPHFSLRQIILLWIPSQSCQILSPSLDPAVCLPGAQKAYLDRDRERHSSVTSLATAYHRERSPGTKMWSELL